MLTKRTQILLKQETWDKLKELSKEKNTSIGNLIRDAIDDVYLQEDIYKARAKAIKEILRTRQVYPGIAKHNYKDLINDGRKY